MELFEFINVFFNKPHEYEDLSLGDKTKHVFMLNRFFSIKYPLQANMFNVMHTSPLGVVESWKIVAASYKRTPGWIYTKVKRVPAEKIKNLNIDEDIIKKYMESYSIGFREFYEAVEFDREAMLKILKSMENAYNVFKSK